MILAFTMVLMAYLMRYINLILAFNRITLRMTHKNINLFCSIDQKSVKKYIKLLDSTAHGRALFALGGESEHYSKETDDIKEMFIDLFKNISEKYLPMIHI